MKWEIHKIQMYYKRNFEIFRCNGNGCITHLITNYILHKSGDPMFDIDHKIRNQFYTAIEKADKKEDNELPFILWFVKNYLKANKKYQ